MAKYSNTVEYQIRTTLDSSGIAKLKAELQSLQNTLVGRRAEGVIPEAAFKKTMSDIKQVEAALTKAFNGKLGMLDLNKFNTALMAGGRTLNDYYKSFSSLGATGTRAFGQMYGQLTKVDKGMKQVSSTTDKIVNTFGNTFRWGMIASVFSSIMNAAHQSVQYVKDLDESLTNIMMVSGETRDNMNEYARAANDAAKVLGNTTVGMTNATQVFVQQGYDLPTSQNLAEYAVKLGNVSQQDTATASDELTAYMNAYKIDLDDIGNALSKWALVANVSAADVQELSIASQKAASAAVTTGVNMDQLAAQIAAIETVTREAPENIGNGLKTIYARFSDIRMGETLEDGVDLGKVTSTLEKVGVDVLNAEGNMREVGDIMEDLMDVWGTLDLTQKNAIGQTLAGKFQYSRFSALMNRSDLYKEYLAASEGETGTQTLDFMQETYEESMQGRLNTLTASIEGIFTNAFETNQFYKLIDVATELAQAFDKLIQSVGGGDAAITALAAIITRLFSKNIAQGVGNNVLNRQTNQLAAQNMNAAISNARITAAQGGANIQSSERMNQMTNVVAGLQKNMGTASNEQLERINNTTQKYINITTEAAIAEEKFTNILEASEVVIRSTGVSLENNATLTDRYAAILQKLAEAEADGVAYDAAMDEMYKALEADMQKLSQGLITLADDFINDSKAVNTDSESMAKWQKRAQQLNAMVKELMQSEALSIERREQLAKTSEILTQVEKGQITSKRQLTQAIQKAGMDTQKFYESLKMLGKEGVDVKGIIQQLSSQLSNLTAQEAVATQEMQGLSRAMQVQSMANGMANIASGAMNVMFAVQSIHSAINALGNEDLDTFEKFEQSLMGFSMAAAMTAPMIANLVKWINTQNQAVRIATITQAAATLKEKEHWAVTASRLKITKLMSNVTQGMSKAELKEIVIKDLANKKTKTYTDAQVAAIVAKSGLSAAEVEGALIEAGATKITVSFSEAVKGLARSMWTAIAPMAPFIAAAAAIAAVIGVSIVAFKAIHDSYYRFDLAVDKAKENLKQANERLEQNKEHLSGITQILNELDSKDDVFKDLTKGTTEWTQALLDANNEVLELIEKYPELAQYIEKGEYGQLTFSAQGLAEAQRIAQRDVAASQYGVMIANEQLLNAQRNQTLVNTGRHDFDTLRGSSLYANADDILMQNLERASDIYNNALSRGVTNEDDLRELFINAGYSSEQADQLVENTKQLAEVHTALEDNSLQLQTTTDAYMTAIASLSELYQGLEENEQEIVNAQLEEMYGKDSEAYREAATQAREDVAGMSAEEKIDYYAALGYYGEGVTVEHRTGKDRFYDANHEEIDEFSDMRDWEAANYGNAAHIDALMADQIEESTNELSSSIAEATDYLDAMTQENFSDRLTQLDKEQDAWVPVPDKAGAYHTVRFDVAVDMSNLDSEMKDLFLNDNGEFIDQETFEQTFAGTDWASLGFDSAEEAYGAFYQGWLDAQEKAPLELYNPQFSDSETQAIYKDAGLETPEAQEIYYNTFYNSLEDGAGTLKGKVDELNQSIEETDDRIKAAVLAGDDLEAYILRIQKRGYQEQLKDVNAELNDLAIASLQTSNAVETLSSNWEKWDAALDSDDPKEYAAAMAEMKPVIGDLLNVDPEFISEDFIKNHQDLWQRILDGDEAALDEARIAFSQEITVPIVAEVQEKGFDSTPLEEAVAIAQQQLPDLEVGATLDLGDYQGQLEALVDAGAISVEQLETIFDGAGYDVDVQYITPELQGMQVSGKVVQGKDGYTSTLSATPIKGGNAAIPIITFTRKGNGGISGRPPSGGSKGGGGGKGGGGKGGGSGKSYEAKTKDYEEKEKDRYEKVNTALDKIDSTLQNIEMDQDRLISNRWLDNLGKETDLLKEQIPWYEKKLEIQKEEAKELRDQLSADFGATFYDNGQLKNYADIFDRLENERKRLIEQYNATGDEAGQTALEKQIEDIEKKQDTFDKIYSRYDELYSKDIPDTEKALKEIQDRLEDIADEAREARREAAETLDDIRKTSEEFEQTMGNMFGQHIELDLAINSQRLEDVIGNPTAVIQDQIDRYQQMLEDSSIADEQKKWLERQIGLMNDAIANGTSILDLNLQRLKEISQYTEEWERNGFYTIDGQRSYNEDALHEMWSQALDDASNFAKELESVIQNHLDLLDDLVDNMQDAADNLEGSYDAIGDKIEYILDMNELLYGEQASQDQVDLYRQQAANDEERLKALEREKETAHIITEERRRLWEADKDNVDAQQAYYDALDNERDIDSEILDIRKDITQAYKDAEEAANELAVQDWLSNFAGTINGVEVPLEYMADQWERISENEDLYLDDLNKAYEIQKLQNEYQKMLNEATDPAIQAQITDQMNQQLEYLRDKTNLSKYDVEYANAQLEILQKTIALEDARDAKNQMKLRRDSQGNYQYVYTTNKNDVASAENDLLDASMNAYNMSKEQQGDVQDNYIKKVQDMADAMRKVMNDATLDAEQRQAIIEDIIQSGYEYLDAMGEQLSTSQRNMIESFIEAAEEMQSQNAEYVQLVADGLKEGTINTLDEIDDRFDTSVKNWIGEDGLALFRDEAENTKDDIVTNIHEFEDATNEANENLAQPLNDLETNYADVADEVARTKEEARELFDLLGSNTDVFTKAAADVAMWQSQLEKSNSAIQDYKKQIKSLQDKNAALEAANTQLYSSGSADGSGSGGAGLGSGAAGLGKKPGDRRAGDYTGYTGRYYENSWGEGRSGSIGSGVKGAVKISAFSAKPYGDGRYRTGEYSVHLEDLNGGYLGWIKPSQMFDTGGYTGNWNGDGRMAMLHQKELVLNATDTENILAAVDAVRLITEQLKASSFVNNIVNAVGRASQNKIQGSNVEQRVEITANFPNVNSAEEIERALLSISDTSYQYAYNKNNIPW